MPPSPTTQKMGELHEVYLADVNGGAKSKASGSQWDDQGDGRNRHDDPYAFCWDGKSTRGQQIAVTLAMIAKIREQAQGERPQVGLRWYGNDLLDQVTEDWVAVQAEDWRQSSRRPALALLEAEHGDLGQFPEAPVLVVRLGRDVPPDQLESFRGELEAMVSSGTLPEWEDEKAPLVKALREEISALRDEAATMRTEAEAANSRWADAMNGSKRLREELDQYRAGKVIPPYVPRLPWTVVFQVRLPGAPSLGMHYDADGAVTQFAVREVRVERHMGNRPRLIVNNLLTPDGDLYADGALQVRAWRDNRDGEARLMPTLTKVAAMAATGCLVKPLFYQWVMGAESVSLNLLVERPVQRRPDSWFHASSHPLASSRELWLWLAGRTVPEDMGYTSLMAVMFGSLAHAPVEAFLDWMKVSEPLPAGACPACGKPRRPLRARPSSNYCTEHGFAHPETRARCHLDAILNFSGDRYGFDFKTIWPLGLRGVKDMDLESFKAKWPGYWAQMQECMRLSGLRQYIVLFLTMGSPWELREYHIPFDPDFAALVEKKYRGVIDCWERGVEILI